MDDMNLHDSAEVISILKERLEPAERADSLADVIEAQYPHARKAAVLLGLFDHAGETHLAFVRRAATLRSHSGEIAFPGGAVEPGDDTVVMTALREAREEIGLELRPADLRLTGLIAEHGYQGQSHWLMFLFEVKPRLKSLPPAHREGRFKFFRRDALASLKMPQTDLEQLWPLFWQHRGGFFAAHCHCHPDGRNEWTVEESIKLRVPNF